LTIRGKENQKEGRGMKYPHAILLVLLGFFLGIFLVVGCAAKLESETLPPEDVAPTQEGAQVESELEVTQDQNGELDGNCDDVKSELEATRAKHEELQSEYSELNTKYTKLKADCDELSVKYNTVIEGTAGISGEDVEQAIFEAINQDRKDNGLNELEWTDGFYEWAKEHSDYMAKRKRLELTEESYWQDVFRAAGYSTLDRIANATLMVWKESTTYKTNFLNEQAIYGTVAVSKSGEIFYITYFAHTQK